MAGNAAICGSVVFLSDDMGHLIALPAALNVMTFVAADTCVFIMCENRVENVTRLRRAAVWCKLVTDVAASDFALWRVALITSLVRVDAARDRFPAPAGA